MFERIASHEQTDVFAKQLDEVLGADHGIKTVKQDGFQSGTGMFAFPKHDFFEFPSGMQVATLWFIWNMPFLMSMRGCLFNLADGEKSVVAQKVAVDLRDGHSLRPVGPALSPCLEKFRG